MFSDQKSLVEYLDNKLKNYGRLMGALQRAKEIATVKNFKDSFNAFRARQSGTQKKLRLNAYPDSKEPPS